MQWYTNSTKRRSHQTDLQNKSGSPVYKEEEEERKKERKEKRQERKDRERNKRKRKKKKKKKKAVASALPDVFRQPVKQIPRQQLADLVGR